MGTEALSGQQNRALDLATRQKLSAVNTWSRLAGFPGLAEEQGERVLEKGTGPGGETLRPPMHIYHMNPADAKAITSYLRSLPEKPH